MTISEDASVNDSKPGRLAAILRVDEAVYYRLYELSGGESISALKTDEVYNKLMQPRFMDTPPVQIKLPSKNGLPSGTKELFKFAFNSIQIDDDEEMGSINLGALKLSCDLQVIKTVKTLLKVGTCRNEDLSSACRTLVYAILRIGSTGDIITKNRMLDAITHSNYYEEKLVEAIKIANKVMKDTTITEESDEDE